jgi:PelA/Pel-15E family pectate lyase
MVRSARDQATTILGAPRACRWLVSAALVAAALAAMGAGPPAPLPSPAALATAAWDRILEQPAQWYRGAQARAVAENVLHYQNADGGWPKNIDMTARAAGRAESTIDNGATVTQLRLLARVHEGAAEPRFRRAIERGLDGLLDAQYQNGGWPQYFPGARGGYHRHVTYNDGAMINVMELLNDVAARRPPLAFLDERRRARSRAAVDRGVSCILATQIVERGAPTVWCAQHDERSLRPAPARSYELASKSGSESAGITLFLMTLERPSAGVIRAVEGAVAWFRRVQLRGIRVVNRDGDKVVVDDAAAPSLWARFYELETDRPFFCGRDGVVKYTLGEIEKERRTGYAWYVEAPRRVLERYPAWRARWGSAR